MLSVLVLLVWSVGLSAVGSVSVNDNLRSEITIQSVANVPVLELQALYDLYMSTDGPRWLWQNDYQDYGIPWNFTAADANPCIDHWQGINCTIAAPYVEYHVTEISLANHLLIGTLPSTLDGLTELIYLDLHFNILRGTIPANLGNLTQLEYISLGLNRHTGMLPASLGNLTNLVYLEVTGNKLTGTIPDSFQNLHTLQFLVIDNNKLSGTIPEWIGDSFALLRQLFLSNNKFSHTLPTNIGNLTTLHYLECDTCGVVGTIPESYANLVNLQTFVFGANDISGSFPQYFNSMPNLFSINLLYTMLTGTLPTDLILPYMTLFQVDHSMFHGHIPHQYGANMPLMNLFVASQNAFSGSIPATLGDWTYLTYFYVDRNKLTGTIPSTFAQLSLLWDLQVQYNHLTGTLDDVFSPSTQIYLNTVIVDHNQLTGELPAYLFIAPSMRIFSGVQNCFHGTVPASICDGKGMTVLVLDGLTTASSCRYQLTPGISKSYVTEHGVSGTVPTCLFQMPNLTTLHLSGNRLTGTLPTHLVVSHSLFDLSLSHNVLTGSIPVQIQQRKWYNLDLSYNRFSGTVIDDIGTQKFNFSYFTAINSKAHEIILLLVNESVHGVTNVSQRVDSLNPVYGLENNRLSGRLPDVLLELPVISILGTNMFSCALDGSGIPVNDPDRLHYQCGSTAFNIPYYIWLSLCGAIFGALAAVYVWRHRIERYIGLVYIITHLTQWLDYSKMQLEGRGGLLLFGRLIDFLSQLTVLSTAYTLIVLIPLYCALSATYGIMTYEYAWSVSAAFMSGSTPVALEIVLWTALLFLVLRVFYIRVKSLEVQGSQSARRSKVLSVSLKKVSVNTSILIYALYTAVNLTVVVGVNVAYVYIAIYESSELLVLAQVLMSFFKLIWNTVCTSRVLRVSVDYVAGMDDAERMFHEADYVSLQVFVALLNNIIIPCCVVAVISPSCFYTVFAAPPTIKSYYVYKECKIFDGDGTCEQFIVHQDSTSYDPPYAYNYQCSSSLITYYAPAFVNLCIVSAVLTPLAQFVNYQLHRRAHEGTVWFRLLDTLLPRVLKPFSTSQDQIPGLRSASRRQTYFNINRLYISLMTFVGLVLTYGVVFPPLAFALCITVLVNAYYEKLKVGRFLCAAVEQKLPHLVDFIDQDCQAVGSVPLLLHNSTWMVVTIACWFFTLFLFDTLGDAVGLGGAYWVLIVMPLLLPLCLYWGMYAYQSCAGALGHAATPTSKPTTTDPENNRITSSEETIELELVEVTVNPLGR